MNEPRQRADVLIEALPCIQRFCGSPA